MTDIVTEKFCTGCSTTKDRANFSRDKNTRDGFNCWCRQCVSEYDRKHYAKNRDKKRNYRLKYGYGITLNDYNRMLEKQDGKCAICGKFEKLDVDHCHKNGKVRGLLCQNCNKGIGLFAENVHLLDKAKEYLLIYR